MKKSIAILVAALSSGSVWAGVLSNNPDLYGTVWLDSSNRTGSTVIYTEPARTPYTGILDYGEIVADNLSRPGTTMVAGQPAVGDVTGRPMRTARIHERPFAHPDLDQSVLSDIGYNF